MGRIEKANAVPIHLMFRIDQREGDVQVRCPFKEKHRHGDRGKSARIYIVANTVHCFTENKTWGPVNLVAQKLGISRLKAADLILLKFGEGKIRVADVEGDLLSLEKTRRKDDGERRGFYNALGRATKHAKRFVRDMANVDEYEGYDLRSMVMNTAREIDEFVEEQSGRSSEGSGSGLAEEASRNG